MLPHPLDLIALILGILFVLRQMDVGQRSADLFPEVPAADFESWKQRAGRAYRLGSSVCFGKVLLDIVLSRVYLSLQPPAWIRLPAGIALDVAWAALVIAAWIASRRARALARELGIERLPGPSQPN